MVVVFVCDVVCNNGLMPFQEMLKQKTKKNAETRVDNHSTTDCLIRQKNAYQYLVYHVCEYLNNHSDISQFCIFHVWITCFYFIVFIVMSPIFFIRMIHDLRVTWRGY